MQELQALLARLRDPSSQEDWESWRVFADLLLEQGDARGELIALAHQVTDPELSSQETARLMQRAAELEDAHRAQWLGGLLVPPNVRLQWRYGFVTAVRLHLHEDPLGLLQELCARTQPWLLTSAELSECPLRGAWPVPGLSHLSLRKCALGPAGAELLARSEPLRGLARLDLYRNALGDAGAGALSESEPLSSLLDLDLQSNDLGPPAASSLAHGALSSLQRLNLRSNRLGPEGARALAHATSLSSLQRLDLDSNALGPEGARALARGLSSLRELDLGRNALGDEGALALEARRGLTRLNLWSNGLEETGKAAVSRMRGQGMKVEW